MIERSREPPAACLQTSQPTKRLPSKGRLRSSAVEGLSNRVYSPAATASRVGYPTPECFLEH